MEEKDTLQIMAELSGRLDMSAFQELPDLGLYMDQVTGYLNRRLKEFSLSGDDAPLTSSMINNYVKSGHISRPTHKKYSQEQIAALYMLCSLKNDLSIPDAAALIWFMTAQDGSAEAYDRFIAAQKEALERVGEKFRALPAEPAAADLVALAMDMAQRACAERLAAEALITHLLIEEDARTRGLPDEEEETPGRR